MEYEEHEKRAWSVDFSRTEPSMLVSGSDDCKVLKDHFSLVKHKAYPYNCGREAVSNKPLAR